MEISLIYPTQLFENHPALSDGRTIYFVEEPLIYGKDKQWQLEHHAHRHALLKEAGDAYVKILRSEHDQVEHLTLPKDVSSSADMLDQLPTELSVIHLADVIDDVLRRRITTWAEKKEVALEWYDSPNFLSPESWWRDHFRGKKKLLMATFYQMQRKRMKVLMEDDGKKPLGGKWSFDDENRKKLPKSYSEPALPKLSESAGFSEDTQNWVKQNFPNAWGNATAVKIVWPTTHQAAQAWLAEFLKDRFHLFGDYEDALSKQHHTQQHSLLTPMLNMGLLTPQDVVDQALKYASENDVPMNSLEGFVRQIIGWREFMRCMYELHGREMRLKNYWGFEQPMPQCFYSGKSGLPPVDTAIKNALKTGYCHHIERLMVLGVIFQLCHVKPTAVYQWFMELFIDAYDWVMVPNVYGMSQFADGGKFVTKPYVCGSNYIRKMSNYPKGEWCDIWDALFWDFIAANREFYKSQPRLGMMTIQLDKMGEEKLTKHRKLAQEYREKIHTGWEAEEEEDLF
ncbi:MAG: cryptochrome/photolyase family protein [Akkermansiaceae bacterium]